MQGKACTSTPSCYQGHSQVHQRGKAARLQPGWWNGPCESHFSNVDGLQLLLLLEAGCPLGWEGDGSTRNAAASPACLGRAALRVSYLEAAQAPEATCPLWWQAAQNFQLQRQVVDQYPFLSISWQLLTWGRDGT